MWPVLSRLCHPFLVTAEEQPFCWLVKPQNLCGLAQKPTWARQMSVFRFETEAALVVGGGLG